MATQETIEMKKKVVLRTYFKDETGKIEIEETNLVQEDSASGALFKIAGL